ncbi:MAG TPA: proline dehydrogenase family protein [Actinomycetota bacterium]|nr:proline dehydrogenase family protein [Actinomycetota bacterium]
MNPARDATLLAARSRWLAAHLPRSRFVRATVARFMPGERMEDAIEAAERLAADDIPTTFTYLGENVEDAADADAVLDHYLTLLDLIEERGLDAEVSVKPTHLGLDLDAEETFGRLHRLAERSATMGKHLFLDMESAAYVEPTLAMYRRLRQEFENTGVCIQVYLHRTPQDVADLLAAGASIRLVKGAYREHGDVAIHDRRRIRATFQKLALEFLRWSGGGRLALASHDVPLLTEIERRAAAAGFGRDAYEIQMLYGIRVADQKRLAREGSRIRVLISYGSHWYPWFMRRLAEHPGRNVWLAIRNLFARR